MPVLGFLRRHPYVTAGIVLAVGMVIMLLVAAHDVGLTGTQLLFLALVTAIVGALCAWILRWDSRSDA
jgi:hypothetical protein